MLRRIFLFLLFVGFWISSYGQDNVPDRLESLFQNQLTIFPQEKIHLHTDKPYYISGEKIWFRAYVADAATHVPHSVSRYVYVELINPLDSVVVRVKIRPEEEAYFGHIPIPDKAPEGNYTLRAYTAFMRNMDEDYFFIKTIHIGDTKAGAIDTPTESFFPDFDVSFYPEGGSLMLGTACRIAFKATNSKGQATEVSGAIYNQNNIQVNTFESDRLGMGRFSFIAQKGETYYALCANDKGKSKRFDLPAALDHGYALSVDPYKEHFYVSLLRPAECTQNEELYLLAHVRGIVYYAGLWDNVKNLAVIPKEMFPSGVLHLILFNAMLQPVSERLVFIKNDDQAQVISQADATHFMPRSLVKNRVTITHADGLPLAGSFSVAVTSDREVQPDSTSNILTQLLLTSDLRGNIEHPAFYFLDTPESALALDRLMLTQGWRRYHIEGLGRGDFIRPTWPLEIGPEISGTVKSLLLGRPVRDAEVDAVSLIRTYSNSTQTDKDGRFYLAVGELPDSTEFIVSAVPKTGMTGMDLTLDKETFPERSVVVAPPADVAPSRFVQYAQKVELQYLIEGDSQATLLPEAVVTAERPPPHRTSRLYNSSSYTMTEERLEKFYTADIYQMIARLPGVLVAGKTISIPREVGTTNPNPLVLVNDMPVDIASLDVINVHDVAQIDLLVGPATAIFGMVGGSGVIAIFTKDGTNVREIASQSFHIKTIMPLGYQQPIEFYAPKYPTDAQRNSLKPDLRTTIHWEPVVQTDDSGAASFEFYTADDETSYTVVIEGLAYDGTIIRKEEKLWQQE